MSSLDDFESILKEVVQAKRLSASKMGKLTDIALKYMNRDTQLVSILYRTHKSLPPAAKVSSLYVFDALSRAARHQVNKQGLTGDINSQTGNSATFLLKVEGVLEGLFQDMIMVGSSESKEKTKKILDIWVKGNTFPSAILAQLAEVVKEAEKEPEEVAVTTSTSDPRAITQPLGVDTSPQAPPQTPILPGIDPQSTLLALLTQAASAAVPPNNGQTTTNTGTFGPTPPQLDPTQLAVLQQLAQTAQLGNIKPSQPIPVSVPPAPPSHPNTSFSATPGGPSRSPNSFREEPLGPGYREPKFDRYDGTDRGRGYDDHYDDRGGYRGGYRGRFRGRGRGDGRSRWDDRDRFKDKDWSPPRRVRRSRSRSPPSRYGFRRDVKPYSPPRRPSIAPLITREQTSSANNEVEKDEFGRDIRPISSSSNSSATPPNEAPTLPPPAAPVEMPSVEPPLAELTINHDQMSLSPSVAANTSSGTPEAALVSNTESLQLGLEKFDRTTFDFTAPASWEALGKMWQVTYGYSPSTEELMQYVVSGGNGTVASQSSAGPQEWSEPRWGGSVSSSQQWRGGQGRGGGFSKGGRGSYGHGNIRDGQERWDHDHQTYDTDAIVLGGSKSLETSGESTSHESSTGEGRSGGLGGRMQRVGDKWVFVRDPAIAVP